jgi:hypothetical protein
VNERERRRKRRGGGGRWEAKRGKLVLPCCGVERTATKAVR